MATLAQMPAGHGPRHSILDLAPLELHCMNVLWSLGEGSVRQIQQLLADSRPRAYTTIMTIMDRLARKGVVTRRKLGRAYLYRPNLSAEQARGHALEQVVEGFFEGSAEALVAHLSAIPGRPVRPKPEAVDRPSPRIETPQKLRAGREVSTRDASSVPDEESAPTRKLDASLL
jgi:predicted transcriptional regulator